MCFVQLITCLHPSYLGVCICRWCVFVDVMYRHRLQDYLTLLLLFLTSQHSFSLTLPSSPLWASYSKKKKSKNFTSTFWFVQHFTSYPFSSKKPLSTVVSSVVILAFLVFSPPTSALLLTFLQMSTAKLCRAFLLTFTPWNIHSWMHVLFIIHELTWHLWIIHTLSRFYQHAEERPVTHKHSDKCTFTHTHTRRDEKQIC